MRFIISCLLMILPLSSWAVKNYKLWYDTPASTWIEALPLGNGRLGAMVFGVPAAEHLQLNESSIWAGKPNDNANPEAIKYLPKVRQLIFDGKYAEAQAIVDKYMMSTTNNGMPYEPFGDLYINFPTHTAYTNYYRELSLDSARTIVRYRANGVNYQRETITSFPDQVVMIHITADKPGSITCDALMTSSQQDVSIKSENKEITLSGVSGWHEGLKGKVQFMGRLSANVSGGALSSRDGVLSVVGADEVTFYLSIATNFNNYDDISGNDTIRSKAYLVEAMKHDYSDAVQRHVAFFKHYMDRVNLDLGEDTYASLPTNKRIADFKKNHDLYLAATYFRFGRYLLICSSQPGGQAPNLQGIWNDKMLPAWDSKYTCNINLEMNYWPSEVTNLTELNEPLFHLIKDVSVTGENTAKVMYNAPGWVLHHNTDLWRITGPVDHAASGMWPTGGAWLCHHLWEHYLFTGDTAFLHKVYPIMKGAAQFFNATLIKEPEHGWLVVSPSLSPENVHESNGKKIAIAAGATLDNLLIKDLFNSVIYSSKLFNEDASLSDSLKEKTAQLPPLQIGRWGQLQEWMDDWDDPTDNNRHVSHLYALYPGAYISPYSTPKLFNAARISLIHRGDESTGWSMGWKVCLWARLLDGNHAWKLIGDQLSLVQDEKKKGGTYPDMFDAHPPFQIDGNFGCTAGIAEMLLQSHDKFIYLLPALPAAWKQGSVSGLCARGGFEIAMAWKENNISKVTILSKVGGNCRLRSRVPLKCKGLVLVREKIYADVAPTYLYELHTIKGETYKLVR